MCKQEQSYRLPYEEYSPIALKRIVVQKVMHKAGCTILLFIQERKELNSDYSYRKEKEVGSYVRRVWRNILRRKTMKLSFTGEDFQEYKTYVTPEIILEWNKTVMVMQVTAALELIDKSLFQQV